MQDERIEQRVRAAYRARACAAGVACGAQIFAVGTGLLLPLALNAAYWAAVPALLLGGVIGFAAPRRLSKAPGSAFCAVLALSLLVCGALLLAALLGLSAGSPALMLFLPPQELETPAPVPKAGFFALRVVLGGLFGVLTLAALSLCNPYALLRDQHVWGARMTILSSARPHEGLVQALLTLAQLFALLIGAVSTLCAAAQALGRAFSKIQPLSLWLCALGALGLLLAAAFFGMDVLLCASPLLLLPEGILLVWSFVKR